MQKKYNKRKSILILGGGVMQIPAVHIARQKGWNVAVAAKDIIPEIKKTADRLYYVDLKDKEAMVETAAEINKSVGLDGVFTAGTDFSTTVAWVAGKIGLPGIPYENALAARDKSIMRGVFKRFNIPSPRFYTVQGEDITENGILPFPLVVKPVDNMGSRAVRRVDNKEELKNAVQYAIKHSLKGRAIVEEFLEGPELSLDAVIYRGKITICGVADRHIYFPPFFVEMGHTMPTTLKPSVALNAEEVFIKGIKALGITYGAAKGDIKITASGPVVGEIAARLSGGYMSGWTYPLSSGVKVTEAALNIAVGMPPGDLKPRFYNTSAERAFISIPGKVKEILGVNQARNIDGVKELFMRISEGKTVEFPRNNMGKCGNIISKAETRDEAVFFAQEAVRKIIIRLEPCNDDTDHFLSSDIEPISAYEPAEETINAIQKLPVWAGNLEALKKGSEGISILSLPCDREQSRDWHGLEFNKALHKVIEITGLKLIDSPSSSQFYAGRLFWNAFLKGGVQGGIYILDTLLALKDKPERMKLK